LIFRDLAALAQVMADVILDNFLTAPGGDRIFFLRPTTG